jgi:predicted dehydrogenase
MVQPNQINRREFMQRSALGGAAMGTALTDTLGAPVDPSRPIPASDKITVGMIGVGARAQQLMDALFALPNVEIVGLCDAYTGRVERTLERTDRKPKVVKDYREILADKSVDTVVIATPDHWHSRMAIDAVRAGKDVYIEKPLTYTIDEGIAIIDEVKKSGKILQVGSQGISTRVQQKAREIIASGRLGQITMIRAQFNRNTPDGAWIYPIPPDASPKTVDWEMFVHLVTSIHFMMNAKMAGKAVAMGELYRWKESRDVPDTINAVLEYPEGFVANLSGTFNNQYGSESGFQILGTKGSLIVGDTLAFYPEIVNEDNRWIVDSWPAAMEKAYYENPKVRAEEMPSSREPEVLLGSEQYREIGLDSTVVHMRNFFSCVKTRQQPVEDALFGHRAASCAHLVNASLRQQKIVSWDFSRDVMKS